MKSKTKLYVQLANLFFGGALFGTQLSICFLFWPQPVRSIILSFCSISVPLCALAAVFYAVKIARGIE